MSDLKTIKFDTSIATDTQTGKAAEITMRTQRAKDMAQQRKRRIHGKRKTQRTLQQRIHRTQNLKDSKGTLNDSKARFSTPTEKTWHQNVCYPEKHSYCMLEKNTQLAKNCHSRRTRSWWSGFLRQMTTTLKPNSTL